MYNFNQSSILLSFFCNIILNLYFLNLRKEYFLAQAFLDFIFLGLFNTAIYTIITAWGAAEIAKKTKKVLSILLTAKKLFI